MLSKEQAENLVADITKASSADEVSISISSGQTTHLRFALNSPTTSGSFEELSISIRSTFGTRSAAAVINQLDPETIAAGVKRSEEIARLTPEDPEHQPGLGPTEYARIEAWDQATASEPGVGLARGIAKNIADAENQALITAGFGQVRAGMECLANSRGQFGYFKSTASYIGQTARTRDGKGSGWAADSSRSLSSLDFDRVSREARRRAVLSSGARALAPGNYVTILDHACVANLATILSRSMSARSADEGRSFFSKKGGGNRLGETVFPTAIHLTSDPTDKNATARPWSPDGRPQTAQAWIDKGRVATLFNSRFWAKKTQSPSIAPPSNLIMRGGTKSVEQLIASTERGVFITSLWYIRATDPRTLTYTGLTRDGVFFIEDGKIAFPVTNFRWNDSPISVFKNALELSTAMRMPPRPRRSTTVVVPAVKTKSFHLASVSEAV